MTSRWPTKMLADVCEVFTDGDWIESKDQSPSGVRLIQTGNVGEGLFKARTEKARYVSEATFKRLRCTEIFEGDCLISRLPDPVGRSCILPDTGERMITAVDCTIVRFNQRHILPKFFNLYSQSPDYLKSLDRETTGTTRKRISRSKLGQILIPIPPISEQQKIIDILDELFDNIATAKAYAKKNLQNARALFKNYLQSIFVQRGPGWTEKKLSEVCAITSTLVDPRRDKYLDLIHVGAGNIESQTGIMIELKTAREEVLISGKFLFDNSTVLYSKIRPYLMKVARPDFNGLCSADMYPLTPFPKEITRDYLFHLLLSKHFTDYAIKGSARAGMPKVNREHLFEFKVWLPSVKKQNELVAKLNAALEATKHLEFIYQRKLSALDELRKSLLHKAFSGELTAKPQTAFIIQFPQKIPSVNITDLHAGILAIGYQLHENSGKQHHFGHVKAEKIAHMIEAYVGIDLDRNPVKDAAGPNDFNHLKKVEHRAKMAGFFNFQRAGKSAYSVTKLRGFDSLIARTRQALDTRLSDVNRLLELMLPMETQQAEIFSTVYAAWNNLLLDGKNPTDEEIVFESRENWHPDKLKIEREKFFIAVSWLRERGIFPKGIGKRVAEKGG
jgi:type I restriction enzyme, S subunit